MKPSICLTFKVHQPCQLRLYRFFDIGKDSHYYNEFANRSLIRKVAADSYIPMNDLLLKLIKSTKGKVKVAFAISGSALEQMDRYCPEVIESFADLYKTGCVEFICEPYYHSHAAVGNDSEFLHQVKKHQKALQAYFGAEATTFVNTDLVYTDEIGEKIAGLGFKAMLTEGARHILGWRSPNYVYSCAFAPKLKLLLRNSSLSDDLALRFGSHDWDQWPLTADKYYGWIRQAADEQVVNLFMNYRIFGDYVPADEGIFEFFKAFVDKVISDKTFDFALPREVAERKAVESLDVQDVISSEDEERDMSKWLGNELQKDAFSKLYSLQEKLSIVNLPQLWEDYGHLQESDNFYNMNTKFFTDGGNHRYLNPYDTPYEAFINFMNVLGDFSIRVENEID